MALLLPCQPQKYLTHFPSLLLKDKGHVILYFFYAVEKSNKRTKSNNVLASFSSLMPCGLKITGSSWRCQSIKTCHKCTVSSLNKVFYSCCEESFNRNNADKNKVVWWVAWDRGSCLANCLVLPVANWNPSEGNAHGQCIKLSLTSLSHGGHTSSLSNMSHDISLGCYSDRRPDEMHRYLQLM